MAKFIVKKGLVLGKIYKAGDEIEVWGSGMTASLVKRGLIGPSEAPKPAPPAAEKPKGLAKGEG